MGCVQSKKHVGKCDVSHETISSNSEIIVPTSTKKSHHSESLQPASQSYELAAKPINPSHSSTTDEDELVKEYITATVNWRNQHGGNLDLERQLRKQRLEMICLGAFILSNEAWKQYEIISIDTKLPRTDAPYRPDMIARSKLTNRIIHVEIDENGHRGYDEEKEHRRSEYIEEYFYEDKYSCFHFNPNVYKNPVQMANSFTQLMRGVDGLISAHGHN